MQGFNHLAGGIAFTGIFASFTDVNIFEKPEYIGLTVFCSLLPDIDTTNSILGKSVYPLAKYISVKFGHRTITHSLVFLFAICLIVSVFEYNIWHHTTIVKIVFFGILSHDIFDMCTKQGIPFFYPFSRRSTVLPANPSMRISSGDFKTEAIIFVGFCTLCFTLQPLFVNGFWTQYNKTFLTYNHIQREASKGNDILEVTFLIKNGPGVKGLLIDHQENNFWIYRNGKFETFTDSKDLDWKDFRHTKLKLKSERIQVYNVSKDSLDYWLKRKIHKAQIQSNQEVTYFEGAILKRSKDINLEFVHGWNFNFEKVDFTDNFTEIKVLEAQKLAMINDYEKDFERCETLKFRYRFAQTALTNLSDYEKAKMMREIETLKSDIERMEESIKYPELGEMEEKIKGVRKQIEGEKLILNANLTVFSW